MNEHCRDSKNYFLELESWKSNLETNYTENWIINTADVQALYSSINRDLVKNSLWHALKYNSKFKYKAVTILIDLIVFCLNNVILQYKDKFYTQTNGIITGDNHSVSLANIAMHFVLLPISETLNKAPIFKHFINDIVWIASNPNNYLIKKALTEEFAKHDLKLVLKQINTSEPYRQLEFLNVLNVTDQTAIGGFITKNCTKKTTQNRCFLNGSSHHPIYVYKSIVFGEVVR